MSFPGRKSLTTSALVIQFQYSIVCSSDKVMQRTPTRSRPWTISDSRAEYKAISKIDDSVTHFYGIWSNFIFSFLPSVLSCCPYPTNAIIRNLETMMPTINFLKIDSFCTSIYLTINLANKSQMEVPMNTKRRYNFDTIGPAFCPGTMRTLLVEKKWILFHQCAAWKPRPASMGMQCKVRYIIAWVRIH